VDITVLLEGGEGWSDPLVSGIDELVEFVFFFREQSLSPARSLSDRRGRGEGPSPDVDVDDVFEVFRREDGCSGLSLWASGILGFGGGGWI
jgi:hypothetical protein